MALSPPTSALRSLLLCSARKYFICSFNLWILSSSSCCYCQRHEHSTWKSFCFLWFFCLFWQFLLSLSSFEITLNVKFYSTLEFPSFYILEPKMVKKEQISFTWNLVLQSSKLWNQLFSFLVVQGILIDNDAAEKPGNMQGLHTKRKNSFRAAIVFSYA